MQFEKDAIDLTHEKAPFWVELSRVNESVAGTSICVSMSTVR